jgi:hypothetical protein
MNRDQFTDTKCEAASTTTAFPAIEVKLKAALVSPDFPMMFGVIPSTTRLVWFAIVIPVKFWPVKLLIQFYGMNTGLTPHAH